jgi:hypothetical protein
VGSVAGLFDVVLLLDHRILSQGSRFHAGHESSHRMFDFTIALRIASSIRIAATRATLIGLPAARGRKQKGLSTGLDITDATVARYGRRRSRRRPPQIFRVFATLSQETLSRRGLD